MKRTLRGVAVMVALISAFTCLVVAASAQTVNISITGIRSPKGQVVLNVFNNEESFRDEKPAKIIIIKKKGIINGQLKTAIDLKPGITGISIIDDENMNGKLDKNFIGFPQEGFGFSNFYLEGLRRPTFSDFKFEVKTSSNQVTIKVKYM